MFNEFKIKNLEQSSKKVEQLLNESRAEVEKLLKIEEKTYENFVKPYEEIAEKINEEVTPLFHIDSVKNTKITQKVQEEIIPLLSVYETELSQNEYIYTSLKDIQFNNKSTLNDIQKKVLENEIRDFELGGCGLNNEIKDELKQINLKLSSLSNTFSQNLLDATNAFEMVVDDFEDVKEIPQSDLDIARFEQEGKTKYKFTLQMPSYLAYMTYGNNQKLREKIYKAYTTRASENEKIIDEILDLKRKKANILGFENFAQYSLATKMAKSEEEVVSFLYELALKAKDKAKEEIQEVEKLAQKDGIKKLQSYDMAYYSEKLKKAKYDIDQEYYKPYFEQSSVLHGFFNFLNKLFDIEFKAVQTPAWDEKVKVFDIYEQNEAIARIYMDLEARKDKQGGAWMNNWHSHYKDSQGNTKLPTAFIVCNFAPSSEKTPSLLRHDDVVTLFHEMGHALHHLLSKVEEPFVSGISGVAWDCVEFPSQFLEYFSYDKEVLKLFAKHYQTKEVLSDEAIDKIIKARNFQSSLALIRQIEFALFDFKLYQGLYKGKEVQALLDEIREEISPLLPPSYNRFQHGFAHIFAGGYSAGYYSYKWAEVLSADAFYLFLNSSVFNKELALKYKTTILQNGGCKNMDELYFEFAHKQPSVDSLLKIDDIIS
jgi:oligopeptidase A